MSIFGYDRRTVDQAFDEGQAIMRQQGRQIQRLAAENRELVRQVKEFGRRCEELRADKHKADLELDELSAEVGVERRRARDAEQSRDAMKAERDDMSRQLRQSERAVAALERQIASQQQDSARVGELELRLAEAIGVIQGLAGAPPAQDESGSDGGASVDEQGKRAFERGQAALARGCKRNLSDEDRRTALREAKRLLGKLPPKREADLERLEGTRAGSSIPALPPPRKPKP